MSYRPYHTFLNPIAANTYCLGGASNVQGRGAVPAFSITNGGAGNVVAPLGVGGLTFEFLGPGFDGGGAGSANQGEPGQEGITFSIVVPVGETKFLDIAIRKIISAPLGGQVTVYTQG